MAKGSGGDGGGGGGGGSGGGWLGFIRQPEESNIVWETNACLATGETETERSGGKKWKKEKGKKEREKPNKIKVERRACMNIDR